MNIRAQLVGILAFGIAIGIAIAVTRYFRPVQPETPSDDVVTVAPKSELAAQPVPIRVEPIQIVLDFQAKSISSQVALTWESASTPPQSIWIFTYFFVPGENSRYDHASEPVKVDKPFAAATTTTVTAQSNCSWCDSPIASRSGYLARINVSAESPDGARVALADRDFTAEAASSVVVQGSRRASRR